MIVECKVGLVALGLPVRRVAVEYCMGPVVTFDAVGKVEVLDIDAIECFMASADG